MYLKLGFAIGTVLAGLVSGAPSPRGFLPLNPTPADIQNLSFKKTTAKSHARATAGDTIAARALSQITCRIQVKISSSTLGYISRTLYQWGEYGTLQSSTTNALQVRFSYDTALAESTRLGFTIVNGNASYPYFGGISGFSSDGSNNLRPGSYNYFYIGGTAQTAAGSVPVEGANSFDAINDFDSKIESAIWKYTPSGKKIVPQWINSDLSNSTNYILYAADQKTFAITGDKTAFTEAIGAYPEVTFTCVT